MADQEEKRVIVKVAYNYFQSGKWDRALEEYKKLITIDPMDFLVHNMMAEIYFRKGERLLAIQEFLKAAGLLLATNSLEKSLQAFKHVLRIDAYNEEAKGKVEEILDRRLLEIDGMVQAGQFKEAGEGVDRLAKIVPDHPKLEEKSKVIEARRQAEAAKAGARGRTEPPRGTQPPGGDANLPPEDVVKNLKAMAERYIQQQSWDEAVEAYLTLLRFQPGDEEARKRLRELYRLIAQQGETPGPAVIPQPTTEAPSSKPMPANTDPSLELAKAAEQAEAQLRQAMEARRTREKPLGQAEGRNPGTLPPAGPQTETNVNVLFTQADMCIRQNLLLEAMRLCQRILELDPENREVRGLLKQIYDKKNL